LTVQFDFLHRLREGDSSRNRSIGLRQGAYRWRRGEPNHGSQLVKESGDVTGLRSRITTTGPQLAWWGLRRARLFAIWSIVFAFLALGLPPAVATTANGWSGFVRAETVYAFSATDHTIDQVEDVELAFSGDDTPILVSGRFEAVERITGGTCPRADTLITDPFDPVEYPFDFTSQLPLTQGTAAT